MNDFQRLEEIKKILGLSYNKMASLMNFASPQLFYDIKAGKCGITYETAVKIQEYFKNNSLKPISIQWLLTGEGGMYYIDATAQSEEELTLLHQPTFEYNKPSHSISGNNNHHNMNYNDGMIEELIKQLRQKDEQIDRLLKIIERLNEK